MAKADFQVVQDVLTSTEQCKQQNWDRNVSQLNKTPLEASCYESPRNCSRFSKTMAATTAHESAETMVPAGHYSRQTAQMQLDACQTSIKSRTDNPEALK